jgi:pimeloyl-ACP methyl ester carboxylesterase
MKALKWSLEILKCGFLIMLFALETLYLRAEIPAQFASRLEEVSYPFPVQMFRFESQRETLEMAYMDVVAEKPNGRTVLLLHGKNFSGYYWESTIRALAAAGYRIVVPDQIGFGKSSKPGHYQFSFQQLATNTLSLLDHAGIRNVSVVGHSMGGMLATRFALMFPERVEKLALIDPLGLEDWKRVVPYRTVDEWFEKELEVTADEQRRYQMESYYHGDWKPEYDRWVRLALESGLPAHCLEFSSYVRHDLHATCLLRIRRSENADASRCRFPGPDGPRQTMGARRGPRGPRQLSRACEESRLPDSQVSA